MDSSFVSLDEETFDAIYQLIGPDDSGDLLWSAELIHERDIPDRRVWTIVDGEGDSLWCIPGWHGVNFFGYTVSVVAWETSNIEGCYMESQPYCEVCGKPESDVSGEDWCGSCGSCLVHCDIPEHKPRCDAFMFTVDSGGYETNVICDLEIRHDGPHASNA